MDEIELQELKEEEIEKFVVPITEIMENPTLIIHHNANEILNLNRRMKDLENSLDSVTRLLEDSVRRLNKRDF